MIITVPVKDLDKYHFGEEWKRTDKPNVFGVEFYIYNDPEKELKHVIRDLMPFISKDSRYLLIHQALWRIIDTVYSAAATDEYGARVVVERFEADGTSSLTKKVAEIVYDMKKKMWLYGKGDV